MKSRFLALLFVIALSLNIVPIAGAASAAQPAATPSALVAMLPASDAVIAFDTKRFFSDALPKVLASNQPMLSKIVGHVDEITSKTGIDLRKFENVAVGATLTPTAGKNLDIDMVAIARGEINAGALVAMGKLAAGSSYREVKIGEQTAYVFSLKGAMKKAKPQSVTPKMESMFERAFDKMMSEVAVVSTDRNTLVIGSLNRVRQTLEKRSMLAPELSVLMNERSTSILAFALQTPTGIDDLIPLQMDEIGKNVAAIRLASGGLDMTSAGAVFGAMVRTHKPEQAKNLSDMLQGLQMMGGGILSNSKRPDQQVYGRMIQGAKIALRGTDVTLDVTVAQADLEFFGSKIK